MSGYYTYLISSLPMLHFGHKPPVSYARFLETSRALIGEEEYVVLEGLTRWDPARVMAVQSPLLKAWRLFEVALRNELVKARSARRQVDAARYLRADGCWDAGLAQAALNAVRQPSPLEAEKLLDEERWKKLDELSLGHDFDSEALLIYAFKLLILERWERVNTADKAKILEETLQTSTDKH